MQNTLNDQFISDYCTRFTESVIASIASNTQVVTGKEIISLTPSKQVNFFILKGLYGQWQEEMKKLESPFFNYKHEEVKQALTNYMNVLSQHIEVKKEDLKPLVSKAIAKTIYWIMQPGESLKEEIGQRGIKQVSGLKTLTRYFKVYNDDLTYLVNEKQDVSIEEFISEWAMLMDQKSADSIIERELDALNGLTEISRDQITIEEQSVEKESIAVEDPVEEDNSEVDEIFDEVPEDQIIEEEEDTPEEDDEEDTEDASDGDIKAENNEQIDQSNEEDSFDEEEQLVETEDSLNKKFEKDQDTLHDQYKEEQLSVATKHQQKKIASVLEAVSVNQEYMFTTELFGGNKDVFLEAVEKIESCGSFDESVESLVSTYSTTYNWDMNSAEVKELLKVVFRRFR